MDNVKDFKFQLKFCDVNVPPRTPMYSGIVAPVEGWGAGGAVQFELGVTIDGFGV